MTMLAQNSVAATAAAIRRLGTQRTLTWYYDVGRHVAGLAGGYDSDKFQLLKKALARVGPFSESTLRKCEAFAGRLGRADVGKLQRRTVRWRAAAQLANKHLRDEQVTELIAKVSGGRLAAKKLEAAIRNDLPAHSGMTPRSLAMAEDRAKKAVDRLILFVREGRTNQQTKARDALRALKHQIETVA